MLYRLQQYFMQVQGREKRREKKKRIVSFVPDFQVWPAPRPDWFDWPLEILAELNRETKSTRFFSKENGRRKTLEPKKLSWNKQTFSYEGRKVGSACVFITDEGAASHWEERGERTGEV